LLILTTPLQSLFQVNLVQVLLAKRDANKLGHPEEIHPPKYLDGIIVKKGDEVIEKNLVSL